MMRKILSRYNHVEVLVVRFLKKEGLVALRYSLAITFIWFGILKPLHLSPAEGLVKEVAFFFSPNTFLLIVGWWEVLIGLCLLFKKLTRIGLVLMAGQMIGTFLPVFLLPSKVFGSTLFTLTFEGQYIVKNLVLIAGGMVIGSHIRDHQHKKEHEKHKSA